MLARSLPLLLPEALLAVGLPALAPAGNLFSPAAVSIPATSPLVRPVMERTISPILGEIALAAMAGARLVLALVGEILEQLAAV